MHYIIDYFSAPALALPLSAARLLIVPTQPIVTSLWNIGQPSCWSKINKTNRQKIDKSIFLKTSAFLCRDSCTDLCKNGIKK